MGHMGGPCLGWGALGYYISSKGSVGQVKQSSAKQSQAYQSIAEQTEAQLNKTKLHKTMQSSVAVSD
jgi:hypothetical protein